MKSFIENYIKLFSYYKSLADKSLATLTEEQIFFSLNENSNNIAIIMKHMSGNMLSRWTDFLTSDGEKEWRNRDTEFEDSFLDKSTLFTYWEKGWDCLFAALNSLEANQLEQIVYIRNQGQTVNEAINRQIAHYAYHVGQIVFLAKYFQNENWVSLSIPKNKSIEYNQEKFDNEKVIKNFTDEFLK
ncbi:MAG: DUF1572 family protein [Saprospiraceae bacterium]|nr:DUF1572 family protein [Saprospiraceae bacterium]